MQCQILRVLKGKVADIENSGEPIELSGIYVRRLPVEGRSERTQDSHVLSETCSIPRIAAFEIVTLSIYCILRSYELRSFLLARGGLHEQH